MTLACCPLCSKNVRTFWWHGRRIYEGHSIANGGPAELCDATGWLVEDDELVR